MLPPLASATRRVFAAFLPRQVTAPLIRHEVEADRGRPGAKLVKSVKKAETLLEIVRHTGLW